MGDGRRACLAEHCVGWTRSSPNSPSNGSLLLCCASAGVEAASDAAGQGLVSPAQTWLAQLFARPRPASMPFIPTDAPLRLLMPFTSRPTTPLPFLDLQVCGKGGRGGGPRC